MSLRNPKPLRSVRGEVFLFTCVFDTNGSSAPDGLDPDYGTDCALARTGTGTFTLTFSTNKKPFEVLIGDAIVMGDQAGIHAKFISYNATTGVATFKVYDEDDTSGVQAAADTTDVRIQVMLWCRNMGALID